MIFAHKGGSSFAAPLVIQRHLISAPAGAELSPLAVSREFVQDKHVEAMGSDHGAISEAGAEAVWGDMPLKKTICFIVWGRRFHCLVSLHVGRCGHDVHDLALPVLETFVRAECQTGLDAISGSGSPGLFRPQRQPWLKK